MDLSSLRLFVEVLRRGSFAETARAHGLDPSSVSRAIASLEHELGVRLFRRTTRRIVPTEAGRLYFSRVEAIVEELQQAQSMATDLGQRPSGMVRITAPVTFGQLALLPLLPDLLQTYAELRVEVMLSDAMLDLPDQGIDVALRFGRASTNGYQLERLCAIDYVVCASPRYLAQRGTPELPTELPGHDCLIFPSSNQQAVWCFASAAGATQDIEVSGRCFVSNSMGLKQCAVNHLGIVLIARCVVADALDDGGLVELFRDYRVAPAQFANDAWILYPARNYLPLKVRTVVDFLKQRFAAQFPAP